MIRRPPSSVVVETLSSSSPRNICANQSQFHMELLWDGETKVCSNGSGHITNMAAMPIYGKSRKKIFSGTKRPMTLKRCMQDPVLEFYHVCSNNDPCLTLKYLMARSSLVPCKFVLEKVKTIDFSETIVVKVGIRSKLNKYVDLYEYQRSRSFIDLGPSSLRFNIFKLISLETAGRHAHIW